VIDAIVSFSAVKLVQRRLQVVASRRVASANAFALSSVKTGHVRQRRGGAGRRRHLVSGAARRLSRGTLSAATACRHPINDCDVVRPSGGAADRIIGRATGG